MCLRALEGVQATFALRQMCLGALEGA